MNELQDLASTSFCALFRQKKIKGFTCTVKCATTKVFEVCRTSNLIATSGSAV